GARGLAGALPRALGGAGAGIVVRHLCGAELRGEAARAYAAAAVAAPVEPFIADMAAAYANADLVICRAGALTLAELCAAGVASILVPFPAAVDDHQTRNAEVLVEAGAARLGSEGGDVIRHLGAELAQLAHERFSLLGMATAARSLARPQATARIADVCIEVGA